MKFTLILSASCLLLPIASSSTLAGPNAGANLLLHVQEAANPDMCFATRPVPGCRSVIEYSYSLGAPIYVYVLAERGDPSAGIGAAHFGIAYQSPSLNILSWNLCADGSTSFGWPASPSGLTVTWDSGNCQAQLSGDGDGVAAVAGYFYCTPYAPSYLVVMAHPEDSIASVTDCSNVVDVISNGFPSQLGAAGFGGVTGYVPCRNDLDPTYSCDIFGPASCTAGSADLVYSASPSETQFAWTITGNGTIVGPDDQPTVNIDAGGPGSFTLDFSSSREGLPPYFGCSKTVTVVDPTLTRLASWSAIKALNRR